MIEAPIERIDIAARQAASGGHNRRETPPYAKSIERRAQAAMTQDG